MRDSTGTGDDRLVTPLRGWWQRLWLPTSQILAVIGGVTLFLVALLFLGRTGQRELSIDDRYSISFSEIECNSPSGSDRITFLTQVWYLSESPPRVNLLDRELKEKLLRAFKNHPRFEAIQSFQITPEGGLRLELRFRG
jgi:hypothetical protein